MDYEIATQTDVGTVKKTNQDSIMMKRIFTNLGNMVLQYCVMVWEVLRRVSLPVPRS